MWLLNPDGSFELLKITTDEQWTGRYWKDGKKIYTKVIENPTINTTLLTGVDEVVDFLCKRTYDSSATNQFIYHDGENLGANALSVLVSSGNVSFKNSSTFTSVMKWAMFEYTKTTD